MISFVRIDHRLLHGQIVYSWLKTIDFQAVLICNDAVAEDQTRQRLMQLSVPDNKKFLARGITATAAILNNPKNQPVKFFIILENLQDTAALVAQVPGIDSLNLGSIKKSEGAVKMSNSVFLTPEDKALLLDFHRQQIKLDVRQLANDEPIDIYPRLSR